MNELMLVPSEVIYTGREHLQITPYYNLEDVQQSIETHKIKVPFDKIITIDQGFSVCQYCKARYVGKEENCRNLVWKYKTSYTWERGNRLVGDMIDNGWRSARVDGSEMRECEARVDWDLQKQFNEQKEFFEFVKYISNMSTQSTTSIAKYAHTLPLTTSTEYRIIDLERQLFDTQMKLASYEGALRMIAEKMNAAGQNLTF